MLPISIPAVLTAGVVMFVIGFLFHGPICGKLWMKLANIKSTGKEKLSDMTAQMVLNLLADFIMSFVVAMVYAFASTSTLPGVEKVGVACGMAIAFWLWLGFVVTGSAMDVIWMGKSRKLWLYECACSLVSLLAVGTIIGAW